MAHGKRSRQEAEAASLLDLDSGDMARILMLFSGGHQFYLKGEAPSSSSPEKVFQCKTCARRFPSFQALGGHRASHKKPRLQLPESPPPKPKVHGCSICGLEFAVGQALGGHMRRHRAVVSAADVGVLGLGLTLGLGSEDDAGRKSTPMAVTDLSLDLNVPAAIEDVPDRGKLGLAAAAAMPMMVGFRR